MRLFFALWPPAEAARQLAHWAREVGKQAGGRAAREEAIHLTLEFLGEADPIQATQAARRVRGSRCEFPLQLPEYRHRQRIVWVGPRETPPALAALALGLRRELLAGGFALEERDFRAHVTLLRKVRECGALPALPPLEWPVEEFVLVRSTLSREGSRYEILERFPLAA